MSVRVLVVSDARFVADALARALERTTLARGQPGVVRAAQPADVLPQVAADLPDVVLLHLGLPVGPELARAIGVVAPRTATVALGVAEDDASVVAWAEAGVGGYTPPDASLAQVAECVRVVADGGAACTPAAAAILLNRMARTAARPGQPHNLTAREEQVAELITAGLSNKEIARALSISLPTVKNHVHNILGKLEIDGRHRVGRQLRPSQ